MRSLGSSGLWELFVPGVEPGDALQVRGPRRPTAACGCTPIRWPRAPRSRRTTASVVFEGNALLAGRRLDGAPAPTRRGRPEPDVDLRGAPRARGGRASMSAATSPSRSPSTSPRSGSPTWSSCRDGAPVRGFLGLPGHRLLRADRPVRRPRRLPCPRRRAAPARSSASSSTGCPRTSRATSGPWPASTAPRSTSTTTRVAAFHPDWGTLIFNYGRTEVRNFLLASAATWVRRLPRRRAPGRRGGVHALPRLLP